MKNLAIFNTMIVALTILRMDNEDGLADVAFKFINDGEIIDEGMLEDVYTSGLIRHRIANGKIEIGKEYACENNSKNYEACPIKVIRTSNKEDKLIYMLKVVNEGKSWVKEFASPSGKIVKSRQFSDLMPSNWLRYTDFYDLSMKNRKEKREREQAEQTA